MLTNETIYITPDTSITLNQADIIVADVMLHRNPNLERSKYIPQFKVDFLKYLRFRFDLSLANARQALDIINDRLHANY